MITLPNIVDDQFILSAVTGVASGQKAKNQRGTRNSREPILIASPNLPSDHLLGGKGGPQSRLQTKQLMVIKYDVKIATPPSELMAFRAVEEPRLIHAIKELTTTETETARRGMFHPGVTC